MKNKPILKQISIIINVNTTYNNTIINVASKDGNVLYICSAGAAGFKGARRSSGFAASAVAQNVCQFLKQIDYTNLIIKVKGLGNGRESAMRSFIKARLPINKIIDVTPMPHNGCRPKKQRRI